MANPAPAFQVYAKDEYTEQAALSNEEFGAYMRGKMYAWSSGPLPLDNAKRARLLSVDQAAFPAVWAAIVHLWTETPDGWVNGPLEAQRTAHAEHRERQAENGRKGGRPAVQKNPNETQTKPTDNPPLSSGLTQTEPNTKPKPNPNESSAFCTLHSAFSDLRSSDYTLHAEAESQTLSPRTERTADFDAFWAAYPRKVGKGAALRKWTHVKPPLAKVLEAISWQRATPEWTKDGGQFVPHPATWLHQRRWEDEPFHPPQDLTYRPKDRNAPMAVLERNWETTLAQFPSHADMMAEALADERRKQDERAAQRLLKAGAR